MLLGIDVGTSAVKVLVIDEQGRTVGSASVDLAVDRPRDGWTEQPPSRWWGAAAAGIRKALADAGEKSGVRAEDVRAVGLSGQMHGSVFLDRSAVERARDGAVEAIRPAILWNDQRTSAECAEIEASVGGAAELVRRVGNRALTGFTLPKILWLRKNEPENFARLAVFGLPKDFIRLQLTGTMGTDVGDAAGILLLDIEHRKWSAGMCRFVGLDPALLPVLTESATVVGEVTPWAAAQTGLKAGTLVVAGTGDNAAGAIGAGVVVPGLVLATLGTSGVMYVHSEHPRRDLGGETFGRTQTMCAADGGGERNTPGRWCVTGCMLSAAGSMQWARDVVAPGVAFETLDAEAAAVPAGCEGLVFLPHLSGERCPYPDPGARGAWIGLRAHHTRGHLIRAVMEGVTFGMAQMLGLVRGMGVSVERIRLGGGGNKSELWRQMQADVYGLRVSMLNNEEGPAFGAALLGGVGVGVWPTVRDACGATIRDVLAYEPGASGQENVRRYQAARAVYDRLYGELAPAMHALSEG